MSDATVIIHIVLYCTISTILMCWITDNNGFLNKRKLNKRLSDIEYYQRDYNNNKIEIEYKCKSFVVNVDTQRHTNYCKSMMLYINEDLVLTLHILEGDLVNCRVAKFCSQRYEKEIIEIIKAAIKISRKRAVQEIEERYKTPESKSYFK